MNFDYQRIQQTHARAYPKSHGDFNIYYCREQALPVPTGHLRNRQCLFPTNLRPVHTFSDRGKPANK